ncbi:HET-domain-containing protein, partial [Dichomitus squalens LYAD-421 SS1]
MRVLNTETLLFERIDPAKTDYAILSHTWDHKNGEQTYEQLRRIQARYTPEPSPPTQKGIKNACAVARKAGYHYIWIDSCCIDQKSSSELSEAINTMFTWYGQSLMCIAYLADVPPVTKYSNRASDFQQSRWFTRGWTLQELIAPVDVDFYSADWQLIGSKHELADVVEEITGITYEALLHLKPLEDFSVAQRFSWAARRETERIEDRAYSLIGFFDINMPTLYGEGRRAFRRLQEEVMRRNPDQSLFSWG